MTGLSAAAGERLLSVEALSISYRVGGRVHEVVRDITFALREGEVLGLAGESGCGKSTVARAAMGWLANNAFATAGDVRFHGESLLNASRARLRALWGRELAYIPQEVSTGLNPSRRVGSQLREVLDMHSPMPRGERRAAIESALVSVGIDAGRKSLARYPFEFSGGQQQRITIAMATLCRPRILILDEPTTGIDVTLRRETVDVLRRLLAESRMAAIYISHDLAEVADIADRLAILYAGRVMEEGDARDVLYRPLHPYAKALRRAVPTIRATRLVEGIAGTPPPGVVHDRCSFAERCGFVADVCLAGDIPMIRHLDRSVRCVRTDAVNALESSAAVAAVPEEPKAVTNLLHVRELCCDYGDAAPAIEGVTFGVRSGELVGLVGESGSGKSTLLRAVAGLHRPSAGAFAYNGTELAATWDGRSASQRRDLQLIFQNPERSLNPRRSVAQILDDAVRLYHPGHDAAARRSLMLETLAQVRLSPALLGRYPHQLSGGEKQRVAIARAFAARPAILLCDEIVSALDVSVQAAIMRLIRDYVSATGAAAIFVSHDLPVVRMMSAKLLVLHRGRIVESGPTDDVFTNPSADYTRELIGSLPAYACG